jgi:hypothetical protein
MIRKMPVVIHLREKDIRHADLEDELKIDRHSLDRALSRQPGSYAWWSSLHATVKERLDYLEDKLARLHARLALDMKKGRKATEIKYKILLDPDYRELQDKVRKCKSAERFLAGAVRAFDQRLEALRSLAANTRRDRHEA